MFHLMSFLIVTLGLHHAHAGGTSAGGGKGIVCRDANKKVLSAQVLDLWEAENIFGRKIEYSDAPVEEQVYKFGRNLYRPIDFLGNLNDAGNSVHGQDASGYYMLWMQRFFMNPEKFCLNRFVVDKDKCLKEWPRKMKMMRNVNLSDSQDSFEMVVPDIPGCKLEQIVLYQDGPSTPFLLPSEDQVYVNADIFEKLDNTNKAALILHEAIYKFLRIEDRDPDSRRSRRSVGLIMEGTELSTPKDFLVPGPKFSCHNYSEEPGAPPTTWVYLLRKPNRGSDTIQLIPWMIEGRQLLGPMNIDSYVFHEKPPYEIPSGDQWMQKGLRFIGFTTVESEIENRIDLKYEYSFEKDSLKPIVKIYLTDNSGRLGPAIKLDCLVDNSNF